LVTCSNSTVDARGGWSGMVVERYDSAARGAFQKRWGGRPPRVVKFPPAETEAGNAARFVARCSSRENLAADSAEMDVGRLDLAPESGLGAPR